MYNPETKDFESVSHNTNRLLRVIEDAMMQTKLDSLSFAEVGLPSAKIDAFWVPSGKEELLIANAFGRPDLNALDFLQYLTPENHIITEEDFPFLQLSKEAQEQLFKDMYIAICAYGMKTGNYVIERTTGQNLELISGLIARDIADDYVNGVTPDYDEE